ncbi:MAG: hypothetical protein JHD35_01400 [Sphingopyxis sp.]|nr:hypothetical protein [Sphingopyxis sp.]
MGGRRTTSEGEVHPDGVKIIEIRLWVAYGLIALMLTAAAAGIAYIRHNRPARKYHRRRTREDQLQRDRTEAVNTPD